MNEQLQSALAEIITSALQTAEATKEFVLAEMPDVVQQILLWKMAQSVAYNLIALAFLLVLGIYWWVVWKNRENLKKLRDYPCSAGGHEVACYMAGGFATLAVFIANAAMLNLRWLQILLAPKVYLIEYAAQLIK